MIWNAPCWLTGVLAVLSPGNDLAWQQVIPPNAAYRRAQERPPFRMSDPVGLITDSAAKNRQRLAA